MRNKRTNARQSPDPSDAIARLTQERLTSLGHSDEMSQTYCVGRGPTLRLKHMHGAEIEIITDKDTTEIVARVSGWRSKLNKLIVNDSNGLSIIGQPVSEVIMIEAIPKGSTFQRLLGLTSGFDLALLKTQEPEKEKLKLRITVPEGTSVVLDDVDGAVDGKGRYASLSADVLARTVLDFEEVDSLELRTGMNCGIYVERANSCSATLASGTTLRINDGALADADIEAQHNCVVMLKAKCESVELTAESNCNLHANVTGTLKAQAKAHSTFEITCDDAARLELAASYGCTVTAVGRVAQTAIKAGTDSTITLGDVTDRLEATVGYNSSLATTAQDSTALVDITLGFGSSLQLAGLVCDGAISMGHDSTLHVGRLGSGVSIKQGSFTLQTGYLGG